MFKDFDFPPEWPGFGLACFNTTKRRPVMVLVEMQEIGQVVVVGEVEFPSDSRGWNGGKPLTKAAREMLAKLREVRKVRATLSRLQVVPNVIGEDK